MSVALLFPGQGAQHAAMFDAPLFEGGGAWFERARAALGFDVRERIGDPAFRATTEGAQLATFVASAAGASALASAGVTFEAVAGHSVGVYAALVAAGALDFEAALVLVRTRASLMARAFPSGYGMATIAGLTALDVAALSAAGGAASALALAVTNADDQFTLTGEREALERAMHAARERGARRAVVLDIAVPSHSPLLDGVARNFASAVDAAAIRAPRIPFVRGTSARIARTAEEIRDELRAELRTPIRWHDTTRVLYERGTRLFLALPPGDVLSDLAGHAFPRARAAAVERTGIGGARALALKTR